MASTHNETVAMDLSELKPRVWYLRVMNHFTCFSAGSVISAKKPREIGRHIIHCWISVHGPPQRLLTDNGGEFNNKEIREMAKNLTLK